MFDKRRYDNCQNKEFDFKGAGTQAVVAAELVCPRTEELGIPVIARARDAGYREVSYFSAKDNQGKRREYAYYQKPQTALDDLRKMAVKSVCGDCPYAKMSPREVVDTQHAEIRDELVLAEARRGILETRVALEQAYSDIAQLEASASLAMQSQGSI